MSVVEVTCAHSVEADVGSSLSCCVWGGRGVSVNHPMEVRGLVRGLEGGESSASDRSR